MGRVLSVCYPFQANVMKHLLNQGALLHSFALMSGLPYQGYSLKAADSGYPSLLLFVRTGRSESDDPK